MFVHFPETFGAFGKHFDWVLKDNKMFQWNVLWILYDAFGNNQSTQ